ncbi:ATP-dependent RNA helicase MAK5 [Smittium culicis]|uniref:RNA helicase n=1 Tax=Smittium culicis TaxID=133412 RepID=A0A1R1YFF2_9FUNG|nr:ATP-dependent RNA helicase MAK5 [Smittium culicis]
MWLVQDKNKKSTPTPAANSKSLSKTAENTKRKNENQTKSDSIVTPTSNNKSKKQKKNNNVSAVLEPLGSNTKQDSVNSNPKKTLANKQPQSNLKKNAAKSGWRKIELPKNMTMPDNEMCGVLDFEEIDVEYNVGDDPLNTSIKIKDGGNSNNGKEFDDFDDINWDDFIFLDDFSEEKAEKGQLKSIGMQFKESQGKKKSKNKNKTSNIEESATLADSPIANIEESATPADSPIANIADDTNELEVSVDKVNEVVSEQKPKNKKKAKKSKQQKKSEAEELKEEQEFDPEFDVSQWEILGLNDTVLNGIKSIKFERPTEIQERAIPFALSGNDILGAAQTGSGKTLAFGLPIIQKIIETRAQTKSENQTDSDSERIEPILSAVILVPTRELAIQVNEHLAKVSRHEKVRIVSVIGGMSMQKQERLLKLGPEIVVATPGRLWEIVEQTDLLSGKLGKIKFLVLDEADRMLEKGHFKELTDLLRVINLERSKNPEIKRQTMVFSATLNKDLAIDKKKFKKASTAKDSPMQDMINKLQFQQKSPILIDITPKSSVSNQISEARIECLKDDKEIYLYFFLTRFTGKSLVFVNSISALRRLVPILTNLKIPAFPLHASMQQRQRLKNLDRFKESPNGVLVASDVASRGLDIPMVDHVIHYQVPRAGDLYVHRSGRTARGENEGVVIIFVCPEERQNYLKLCKLMQKPEISELPLDYSVMGKMKQLVSLARQIDSIEHKVKKESHESDWLNKAARDMDIEIDPHFVKSTSVIYDDSSDDNVIGGGAGGRITTHRKEKLTNLKNQLDSLLAKPILPPGAIRSFLTGGIVADMASKLLNPSNNPRMPNQLKETALNLTKSSNMNPKKKQKRN